MALPISLIALALCVAVPLVGQASNEAEWYVSTSVLDHMHASLQLSVDTARVKLNNGWTCQVMPGRVTESRRTVCRNGLNELSFVVQCDRL